MFLISCNILVQIRIVKKRIYTYEKIKKIKFISKGRCENNFCFLNNEGSISLVFDLSNQNFILDNRSYSEDYNPNADRFPDSSVIYKTPLHTIGLSQ